MSGELHVPVPVQYYSLLPALPPHPDAATPVPFPTRTDILQGIAADANAVEKGKKRVRRRRATQEAVARGLGYMPTDPDSLSSHDKKRLYLDCLEQYVIYLHEYMRGIGISPVPIERVSSGRGLTSRSIRTLLVYLQSDASRFHHQRQDADVQREHMRAFYHDQLAAHNDGSGADYPPASSSTPTPTSPHCVVDPPAGYTVYVNTEGCYNVSPVESTASYNPYAVGDLASPQSPYGAEHAPSYIATTPTPMPSGLAASATQPMPTSAHVNGPVPPTFGPGPASSDPSTYSQAQYQQTMAQRRHSIATTAYYAPATHTQATPSSSFQQHLYHSAVVHNNNDDSGTGAQAHVNGGGNNYYSSAANSGTYGSNAYIDSNGVYPGGAYTATAMYNSAHQAPQNQHNVYPSGVVVPSNAPPISHMHTYGGGGGAPAAMDSMAGAYPQQGYQFP